MGKPLPGRELILGTNKARDDGVTLALAGPYTSHLCHALDR